jgi:hypothetical protein
LLPERLLPLALARSLRPLLELRLLELRPLEAVPRLLLLRDEEPGFEEEEELRDAIACSLGRLVQAVAFCTAASATRSI